MPRAPGQIDEQKSAAILEAATDLFSRKGARASMAEIARAAGVSKQTLYNRFPSKPDLARALLTQRSLTITAPLDDQLSPEDALTAVAEAQLSRISYSSGANHLQALALVAREDPELAVAIFEAGPSHSLKRISAWLSEISSKGVLSIPDPDQAAEIFIGMVLGHSHLRLVLGLPHREIDNRAHAREAARRFVRAYSPKS